MQRYSIFMEMGESYRSLNRASDTKQQDISSKIGLFVPYGPFSTGCLLVVRVIRAYHT